MHFFHCKSTSNIAAIKDGLTLQLLKMACAYQDSLNLKEMQTNSCHECQYPDVRFSGQEENDGYLKPVSLQANVYLTVLEASRCTSIMADDPNEAGKDQGGDDKRNTGNVQAEVAGCGTVRVRWCLVFVFVVFGLAVVGAGVAVWLVHAAKTSMYDYTFDLFCAI